VLSWRSTATANDRRLSEPSVEEGTVHTAASEPVELLSSFFYQMKKSFLKVTQAI
jgi:hypothetical protein